MTTIRGDVISAIDMTKVIIVETNIKEKPQGLSNADLMWQLERKKRGVRKLSFEIK